VTTIAPSAITLMSKCVIGEITPIHTWAQVRMDDKTARKLCHFKFQQMPCGHGQLCDVLVPPLNHGIGRKTRILLLELNAVLQTRTQSIGDDSDCTQHQLCNKAMIGNLLDLELLVKAVTFAGIRFKLTTTY
jgi:hypothetical protein